MKTTPLRNFTPRKSAGGGDQTAPRLGLLLLKIPRVPRGIDQKIKLLFINNNSISASAFARGGDQTAPRLDLPRRGGGVQMIFLKRENLAEGAVSSRSGHSAPRE